MKRLVQDELLVEQEKQRLYVNELSERLDYTTTKLNQIEKHLPLMI